ncbi:MAG: hypothetical protein A3C61_01485 [Candidatus Yanofskybacteria bacterium RIFCSPHIGHO2_02_FULL_39_10]|uniref:Gfo/Idh/MocA-like oxidoreductase N-terminal domain-containing protein n=1 Tax=Candidatus Yanofskybacteria bacterium RIFCSPHIGHO2_02_FULL_39_10 TaxID=1802674 RepID=A0A1F8F8Z0_9BACT|nr:MAG: hypothetical protein A3C61_01485 [Candidatus Yanofskybacteria bacterium RIFCSPHIGHO2_02_FULL_39_10]
MKDILIIGAGQIGSRHLQALKKVNLALSVKVIDPNPESLKIAQERYITMPAGKFQHKIEYLTKIPKNGELIDLAIIATCSDIRAATIKELLKNTKIKYLILEKILFGNKQDYSTIEKIIKKDGIKAWVNLPIRMMPFYMQIDRELAGQRISYHVSGSKYGLVTNAIHYIDHMAGIIGNGDFKLTTSGLEKNIIPSKRRGFLELNGTINILFKNGSDGMFTCYPDGTAPIIIEIYGKNLRCICRESEGKAWISRENKQWKWEEVPVFIPPQSQLTTELVESISNTGKCGLVTYSESKEIHLKMLEPLRKFLNKNGKDKYNYYPFT